MRAQLNDGSKQLGRNQPLMAISNDRSRQCDGGINTSISLTFCVDAANDSDNAERRDFFTTFNDMVGGRCHMQACAKHEPAGGEMSLSQVLPRRHRHDKASMAASVTSLTDLSRETYLMGLLKQHKGGR